MPAHSSASKRVGLNRAASVSYSQMGICILLMTHSDTQGVSMPFHVPPGIA